MILLGHVPSEESGMKECVKWFKGFIVSDIPIKFVTAAVKWILEYCVLMILHLMRLVI
jgi:hypothetical protein